MPLDTLTRKSHNPHMADETSDSQQPSFTTKQLSFIAHYTNHGSDTWHNARQSVKAAGFSDKALDSNATYLTHNPKIQRRIAEIESRLTRPADAPGLPRDREQMLDLLFNQFLATDNESVKATLLNQIRDEVSNAPDQTEIKALTAAEQATSERIALYMVTHDSAGELSICPHCHRPLTAAPTPATGAELRPEGAGGPQ